MKATLTSRETAQYLGISYWKLLELAKAGAIPHIRVGNRVLFRQPSIMAWLEAREQASVAAEPEPIQGKIRRLRG